VYFRGLCALITAIVFTAAGAAELPVRLATHDQAPYGTYLADKTFDGVAVRVMNCVFKKLNRELQIEVYPWERAQKLAERGDLDGFFPATLKPERLVWAAATEVIADQKWVWYLPVGAKLDPTSASFKTTAKVGAHFGSNRLKTLIDEGYQVVIQPPTDGHLLKALLAGRAEAILVGDLAIAEAMKEQNVNPADFKTVIAKDNPLLAYFGKKFLDGEDPSFIKRFNAQIPKCR
jgi:polar amino acid transport system substrate-binding protein